MRFRWSALAGVVLALGLMPRVWFAQSSARKATLTVEQNYPNPFNPETRGNFAIACEDSASAGGKQHRVSVRIYNVLSQLVAVPVLQGGAGSVAGGQPLENVLLPCGRYTWYWNGNYRHTSQEAATGIYLLVVDVDGQKGTRKMLNLK